MFAIVTVICGGCYVCVFCESGFSVFMADLGICILC